MDWLVLLALIGIVVLLCPVGMGLMMRHRKHAASRAPSSSVPESGNDGVPSPDRRADHKSGENTARRLRSAKREAL